ncbi:MAG TPA: hypothetical protein DEH78_00570 [Solibacterales bacterium]|nr:hypothetical protein [Bryobacterales bacterium]
MRGLALRLTLLTASFLAGFVVQAGAQQASPPASSPGASPYVLAKGDALDIRVYNLPELSQTVIVRPDGKLSLLLVGEVDAAGKTAAQLTELLTAEYGKHVRTPQVAVIVRSFSSRYVYVGGEVDKPAQISAMEPVTIAGAIIRAGGFKDTARQDAVVLVREEDGKPSSREVNVAAILAGAQPDVPLVAGDVVHVQKSFLNVFVGGEVGTPGLITLQGRISVLTAVVRAGGAKNTARLDSVLLLRDTGSPAPAVEKIDLASIMAGRKQDVALKPFDVVLIPKTRVAKVNQFIDQYIRQNIPVFINAGFSYLLGQGISTPR